MSDTKYSVIVIEDEKLLREELILTVPWADFDFEVIGQADNGIEGEKIIKKTNPDLVITDIRMPGQSGLQLLENVFVPFSIILTAHKDFDYVRKAMRIGAFDYLLKPFDDKELFAVLGKISQKLKERDDAERELTHKDAFFTLPTESSNRLVHELLSLLHTRFSDIAGLQEAAEALAVSESHLARIFKENTGMTFLNYLTLYRINRSIQLMGNPRLNIGEIASLSGFVSPGYYAKIFKKTTGKTPMDFRNEVNRNQPLRDS